MFVVCLLFMSVFGCLFVCSIRVCAVVCLCA